MRTKRNVIHRRCLLTSAPTISLRESKLRAAFTLIEMLVVIGVIGILAGMLLGVLPMVQHKSVRSRVKADMKGLETAIQSYKAKHNFYPPGEYRDGFPNTLFYELTGTTREQKGSIQYLSKFSPSDAPLTDNQLNQIFGVSGFLNTAPPDEAADVVPFYKILRPGQVREMKTNGITFKALACNRKGLDGEPAVWRYVAKGTNNVGDFDLWVEVELGGKVIIGNWEK